MAESWRHHYLPQFHLRGFTDCEGMFFVYDKARKRLKRGRYSPKSHFFEPGRNTVANPAIRPGLLEGYYAEMDQTCARLFERLRGIPRPEIDLRMIQDLKLYISMLYWRLPASDDALDQLLRKSTFKDLGFQIKIHETGEVIEWPEFEKLVLEDADFRKGVRFLIVPLATFDLLIQEYDVSNWGVYRAATDLTNIHICSDNPLVFLNVNQGYRFLSPVAFPVSSNCFVYYTPDGARPRVVHPDARIELDCLVFRQAKQYVCGANGEYIESIAELTALHEKQRDIEAHKKYLFSLLAVQTTEYQGALPSENGAG